MGCVIFRNLQNFCRPTVHLPDLPSPANPPFPVPSINFPIFLCQPFNRVINWPRPFNCAPPPPPPPPPPPSSLYKANFLFLFIPLPISSFLNPPSSPFFSFFGVSMAKTRGGSAFRPRVRRSSPPPLQRCSFCLRRRARSCSYRRCRARSSSSRCRRGCPCHHSEQCCRGFFYYSPCPQGDTT